MNSSFQLDSHPDAERLNAFAEQALPERERGLVLAHLASCSRCRQVVFLAQEAASDFAMQEAAAAKPEMDPAAAYEFAAALAAAAAPMATTGAASGGTAGKRQAWWAGNWRIAWVPAAALAATVGVVVYVHVRQIRPGLESGAKLALNVPPAVPQKPAAPLPADRAGMAKAPPAAAPIAAKAPTAKVLTFSASAPLEAFSAQTASAAQAPAAASEMKLSSSGVSRVKLPPQGQGKGAGMQNAGLFPAPAPTAAVPNPEPSVGLNSFNEASAGTASTTMRSADGQLQSVPSLSAGAFVSQPAVKSAPTAKFAVSGPQIAEARAAAMAVRKAKVSVLPSGRRAVSTVTAQHRTLAIDSDGTLFLSSDSGGHWEPVARQWSGHAVAVRVQGGKEIGAGDIAEANAGIVEDEVRSNSGAAAVPAAVFEIANEDDQVWVSTDGKTWKAK